MSHRARSRPIPTMEQPDPRSNPVTGAVASATAWETFHPKPEWLERPGQVFLVISSSGSVVREAHGSPWFQRAQPLDAEEDASRGRCEVRRLGRLTGNGTFICICMFMSTVVIERAKVEPRNQAVLEIK